VPSLAPCVDDAASVAVGPDPLVHVRTPWDRRLNGSWRGRGCRCLTGCPPRGIPKVVSFGVRGRRDQELEGARNTRLRQVRAARSATPYVLYGLYCLLY
jgi:hypothetical protein